jgi:RecJ-like exonuclease
MVTRIVRKAKWSICPTCSGEGKSSAYLGDFSPEEMLEDPDFSEDYRTGMYDRRCDTCNGTGKVTSEDLRRRANRRQELYQQWLESGCPEGSFSKWSGM